MGIDPRSDDYLKQHVEDFKVDLSNRHLNNWSDIVGISGWRKKLRKAINFRTMAYDKPVELKTAPGVLLHSPSGTGKTLTSMSFAKK